MMNSSYENRVLEAAYLYLSRRDRLKHPDGKFDKSGRWYPSETEIESCCKTIRAPSRKWPFSLLVHCRTIRHIANKFTVKELDVRRMARKLEKELN